MNRDGEKSDIVGTKQLHTSNFRHTAVTMCSSYRTATFHTGPTDYENTITRDKQVCEGRAIFLPFHAVSSSNDQWQSSDHRDVAAGLWSSIFCSLSISYGTVRKVAHHRFDFGKIRLAS